MQPSKLLTVEKRDDQLEYNLDKCNSKHYRIDNLARTYGIPHD